MKLNEMNYIERDVSWMYFNRRILDEAQRSGIWGSSANDA